MEENFSMEWNIKESFSMEWNMEWKIFGMEWKKIASMEYGKIIFHSTSYHALHSCIHCFFPWKTIVQISKPANNRTFAQAS